MNLNQKRLTGGVALLAILVAFFLALAATGCKGMIRAEGISGLVFPLCEDHDAYVRADPVLTESEKATRLRTSEILRKVVNAALESTQPAPSPTDAPETPVPGD